MSGVGPDSGSPGAPPSPAGWRAIAARARRSSFLLNLGSVGAASIVNRLIGLITLGYTARVLGPEPYGLVGWGASVVAYASLLLSPGLMTWGVREIARDPARAGRTLVTVNGIQMALAGVAYGGLALFAWLGLDDPAQRTIVLLAGSVIFCTAFGAEWVFNGLELNRIPAFLGIFSTTASTIALLTLVRDASHWWRIPLITTFVTLGTSAVGYAVLLRRTRVRLVLPTAAEVRHALVASLPLGALFALVTVLHHANNLIVEGYLGTEELGIFLAPYRLLELASTLPGMVAGVFLPRLARQAVHATGDANREARLFARVNMLAGFLVSALMVIEAPGIIDLVYGDRYAEAVPLLRLMGVAALFNFAIFGYTNCLISYGKDRVMVGVVLVSAVVSVGGGFLLVPRLGALGAAIVVSVIDLSGWLVSLPAYRRVVGTLQLDAWVRPALGAAVVIGLDLALAWAGVPFLVRAPLAAAGYVPFALLELREAFR